MKHNNNIVSQNRVLSNGELEGIVGGNHIVVNPAPVQTGGGFNLGNFFQMLLKGIENFFHIKSSSGTGILKIL